MRRYFLNEKIIFTAFASEYVSYYCVLAVFIFIGFQLFNDCRNTLNSEVKSRIEKKILF